MIRVLFLKAVINAWTPPYVFFINSFFIIYFVYTYWFILLWW
jgi:hypothetical protein